MRFLRSLDSAIVRPSILALTTAKKQHAAWLLRSPALALRSKSDLNSLVDMTTLISFGKSPQVSGCLPPGRLRRLPTFLAAHIAVMPPAPCPCRCGWHAGSLDRQTCKLPPQAGLHRRIQAGGIVQQRSRPSSIVSSLPAPLTNMPRSPGLGRSLIWTPTLM